MKNRVLTRMFAVALLVHYSVNLVAADPLEFYVWCGPTVTESEYPGFEDFKMDDGKLYVFAQGKGYGEGKHTYVATLYDAVGTVVHQQTEKFDGDDEPWDTWTRYDYEPDKAVPGMWLVDVYLDGRPLLSKQIKVEGTSRAVTDSDHDEMRWAMSKFVEPIYPARARKTESPGFVDLQLLVQQDGTVRRVNVGYSHPEGVFENAVELAAMQWEFVVLSNNDAKSRQRLFALVNFDGARVSVELSVDAPPKREYPYRFLGKTGSQLAVQRLQRFGYKKDQLVNLTSAAYFPATDLARAACDELRPYVLRVITTKTKDDRPVCFIRGVSEVDSDAIGEFRAFAENRFREMGGEPYGLWVQAE